MKVDVARATVPPSWLISTQCTHLLPRHVHTSR